MGEKYVMLQCDRVNAYNQDEQDLLYQNRWINNVNSYGIEVEKGDIITLESGAINTKGTVDNSIEFSGKNNADENKLIDNKATLELSYYINDVGQYTLRLPTIGMSTYSNYGTVNDPSNQTTTKFSVIEYLKNRCLGEVDLSVYDKTGGDTFTNQNQMPTQGYVANFAIESTGSLFQIGNTYETIVVQPSAPPAPQLPGGGLKIMCTDTITEGTIVGALSEFKIVDWGSFDYQTCSLTITNPAASANDATITIILVPDANLTSIFKDKCDGKRYFPAGKGYSGSTLSTENINIGNFPSTNFWVSDLNPNYKQRTSLVNLELEPGLTTPENVSEILTEQLRTPKYFNDSYNKSNDYFNYIYWEQTTRESNLSGLITRRPAALESQTFILNNCNFAPETSPNAPIFGSLNPDTYSLQGVRKRFYSNVAYQNPDKIQGLTFFRNFIYGDNNDSTANQINSGKFQSANEDQGDFQSQRLGNLGLNPCIVRYWSNTVDDVSIPMKKNDLLLTNIYYTEDNIKAIAAGFKLNERYFGDLTKQFDPNSQNYIQNLGSVLDAGYYVDEFSNGTLLPNGSGNQRTRFKSLFENPTTATKGIVQSTDDFQPCFGTQDDPFLEGISQNDSQQLSQFVAKSRFSEDQFFDPNNPQLFQDLVDSINNNPDNSYLEIDISRPLDSFFTSSYIDDLTGNISYETMQSWARDNDLCVVPFFPDSSDFDFYKFGGRPLLCFRSLLQGSQTQDNPPLNLYDEVTNPTGDWHIDTQNFNYGIPIGLDVSFIRNPAVLMINPNISTDGKEPSDSDSYTKALYLGAPNMSFDYDETLSRFKITGMNCPMTIGNGTLDYNLYGDGFKYDVEDTPEQTVFNVARQGMIQGFEYRNNDDLITFPPTSYFQLAQKEGTIIDSYSGVTLQALTFYDRNDNPTTFRLGDDTIQDNSIQGTLFDKMGFNIFDLLPKFGNIQAPFINDYLSSTTNQSYLKLLSNRVRPLTTGLFISSPEIQAAGINVLNQPTYDINCSSGNVSRVDAIPNSLVARQLPSKLDYPYLIVYSSICSQGTNTVYYGSSDGKSKIPAMGFITRNYNQGDFFYAFTQTFSYTATKNFVLSDIETAIMLPNGQKPFLQPNSSVIYKITKFFNFPEEIPPQITSNKDKKREIPRRY